MKPRPEQLIIRPPSEWGSTLLCDHANNYLQATGTFSDDKKGMLDEIHSEIHLEGDLDKDQRKRLLEITTRCPVHRTLSSEIKIRTSEV